MPCPLDLESGTGVRHPLEQPTTHGDVSLGYELNLGVSAVCRIPTYFFAIPKKGSLFVPVDVCEDSGPGGSAVEFDLWTHLLFPSLGCQKICWRQ